MCTHKFLPIPTSTSNGETCGGSLAGSASKIKIVCAKGKATVDGSDDGNDDSDDAKEEESDK